MLSLETFQQVINVNLAGSFIAAREAMKIFKAQTPQGGKLLSDSNLLNQLCVQFYFTGRIINNGSLAAHVPRPNSLPYTCSKHAISGLTKCIALDGRPFNITCTQIDIGKFCLTYFATLKIYSFSCGRPRKHRYASRTRTHI
jgi:NAD(P)-dependent dehydrogenase (short-subunit alcohol dehydrogenase family)